MAQKKYVSLSKLSTFLDNLKNVFATKEVVNSLETTIDNKADTSHTHEISDVANLQSSLDEVNDTLSQKSQVQVITSDTLESLSTLKIHKLTQEEYDQKLSNGILEDNALYLTPNEEIDLSIYATTEQLNGKANVEHSHDDIYYTKSQIDSALDSKSDTSHNHDSYYDAKGSADNALASANGYTDSAIIGVKNDLLNGAGDAYDTLKELGDLIETNVDAIEALEIIASGKADKNHTHNDIYYTETEIDNKVSTINTSISNSLNEAKSYSDTNLNIAKNYTDNAVAQKSQVQIITWEADD